eukprot:CAMPEP_0184649772 /NCGR_PEP_ID=MMETSP0308-20130426/7187_1 /TAXON_ID=38269 /ORGANISM="Gloeochaete witrockiana, Strain SAG 46.84" /LENGTH=482 /DNA_ID=CAMNT_0027082757 /DNA_START=145 /DNA_END=1593 /DNA_ORIENTATION=-
MTTKLDTDGRGLPGQITLRETEHAAPEAALQHADMWMTKRTSTILCALAAFIILVVLVTVVTIIPAWHQTMSQSQIKSQMKTLKFQTASLQPFIEQEIENEKQSAQKRRDEAHVQFVQALKDSMRARVEDEMRAADERDESAMKGTEIQMHDFLTKALAKERAEWRQLQENAKRESTIEMERFIEETMQTQSLAASERRQEMKRAHVLFAKQHVIDTVAKRLAWILEAEESAKDLADRGVRDLVKKAVDEECHSSSSVVNQLLKVDAQSITRLVKDEAILVMQDLQDKRRAEMYPVIQKQVKGAVEEVAKRLDEKTRVEIMAFIEKAVKDGVQNLSADMSARAEETKSKTFASIRGCVDGLMIQETMGLHERQGAWKDQMEEFVKARIEDATKAKVEVMLKQREETLKQMEAEMLQHVNDSVRTAYNVMLKKREHVREEYEELARKKIKELVEAKAKVVLEEEKTSWKAAIERFEEEIRAAA